VNSRPTRGIEPVFFLFSFFRSWGPNPGPCACLDPVFKKRPDLVVLTPLGKQVDLCEFEV